MTRKILAGGAAVIVLAGVGAALAWRKGPAEGYETAVVRRGEVAELVGATGTVEALTTVQVGSQVSGTVESLHADFNSVVAKGQVVARLDPSLLQARLEQADANLVAARANLERARAALEDTRQKHERAQQLAAEKLLPQTELETAEANFRSARAQVRSAEAAVTQAAAAVNQARVDLGHTIIRAPIDGVVVSRSVDVGQTVAASLQAPVLFVIANDLTRIQVKADISEADVGRVRAGQDVTFRVDAYPEDTFRGRVAQVRLQPTVEQNVVTYDAIIAADNPDQRLLPGMTATLSVIVDQREGVLVVPASALRFRPPEAEAGAAPTATGGGPGGQAATPRRRRPEGTASEGRRGLVFVDQGGRLEPRRVALGLSDGLVTEVREGLREGDEVAVAAAGGGGGGPRASGSPGAGSNPFNPSFQRRRR